MSKDRNGASVLNFEVFERPRSAHAYRRSPDRKKARRDRAIRAAFSAGMTRSELAEVFDLSYPMVCLIVADERGTP